MEERREFDAVIALEVQYIVIVTAAGKKGYFRSFCYMCFLSRHILYTSRV